MTDDRSMPALERAARAIDPFAWEWELVNSVTEEHRQHLRLCRTKAVEQARAVLRALRKPDEAMLDAGNQHRDVVAEVWRACIDQILTGEGR